MLIAAAHGFILALGLILPLGAQNIFVFNQGAQSTRLARALPAVLTAAVCDTLLIGLAVAGVSLIILSLPWLQAIVLAIGFFFLLYIGWTVWTAPFGRTPGKEPGSLPLKRQVTFALSVSLLNPHAILDTIGVIGTNAVNYPGREKWAFAAACAAVSWLWFFGLAFAGRWIGGMDENGKWIAAINKISAIIIWGVALYIGFSCLSHLG